MKRPRLTENEIRIACHALQYCDLRNLDDHFPGEGATMVLARESAVLKLHDMLKNRQEQGGAPD